jgi:hypothetical protein
VKKKGAIFMADMHTLEAKRKIGTTWLYKLNKGLQLWFLHYNGENTMHSTKMDVTNIIFSRNEI